MNALTFPAVAEAATMAHSAAITIAAPVTTSTTPLWYATRATGVVAVTLLTVSLVLGILVSVRFVTERWPRFATIGVHRNVSLLTVVFLAIHILTAVVDTYAPVGWLSLVVPFVSTYRPLWLGLGTVAFDLLLALTVTSLLRTRLKYRTWKGVHWASYACWPLAIVHGLGTGTDPKSPVILGLIVLCVAGVLGAGAWRLASGWPRHAGARVASGLGAAAVAIVVAVWTLAGPLAPGWAARSGTPADLLARARTAGTGAGGSRGGSASASALPALPLTSPVTGTISTSQSGEDHTTVTISGSAGAPVVFRVVLSGQALQDGGVQMTDSRVTFGPTAQASLYQGTVTGLNGSDISATVSDRAGSSVALSLRLTINGGSVTGTLTASDRNGQ